MLRLITGKARSGKTAAMMNEISAAVRAEQGGILFIVPEQYSHEAERELCAACGDRLSLYAEVMSMTSLSRTLSGRLGGNAEKYLDKGGRLLCMAKALSLLDGRLHVYGAAVRRAELQAMLLDAVDDLKSACISPEDMAEKAAELDGSLGGKLRDLALIAETYDAVVANGHIDPSDCLTLLAEQIPAAGFGPETRIYVDGFLDFTAREQRVLKEFLKTGAELTVCLTLDGMNSENEIYALSRRAARLLKEDAAELGIPCQTIAMETSATAGMLNYYADQLFAYNAEPFRTEEAEADRIELYSTGSAAEECELAAAKVLELVRSGCRWRDIAVAARGFEEYRPLLESSFRYYGVPLYSADRRSMLSRPLLAAIDNAFRVITGGWMVDDVTAYMRTGLTGLDASECDTLENYIFLWQLQSSAWHRKGDWRQHPEGYNGKYDENCEAALLEINELRRRLYRPLRNFEYNCKEAQTAAEYCAALAEFLRELEMAERLDLRSEELRSQGNKRLADEYRQLWDITVSALEQCHAILGETPLSTQEFSRLFALTMSAYDVGTIPIALDRVSAGDFDRMRRRNIKHLIVIGAADSRLPPAEGRHGVFSRDELHRLAECSLELGGDEESEAWREFSLIYNCLSLPSESLTLVWPLADSNGAQQQPSFVINRARDLFQLNIRHADMNRVRLSAPGPALAAAGAGRNTAEGRAAAEYFRTEEPLRWEKLQTAANIKRGSLSERAVTGLYGRKFFLGATRVERYANCQYGYFCEYGLKAKPSRPAGFRAAEMGTYMHYVLENAAREVKELGGFQNVKDEQILEICKKWTTEFVETELDGFREKTARFIHIFQRLVSETQSAVLDMAHELRHSDFVPLAFELNFGDREKMPAAEFGIGENSITLTGIADRVDGWVHDGKLYLRVADYKSGVKKFSLSDVYNGSGLQMLLYLFALTDHPEAVSAGMEDIREVIPAGVMYVPLRSAYKSVSGADTVEKADEERIKELRRSGLVVARDEIIDAWEHVEGNEKTRYIPVTFEGNAKPAEKLATLEQLGALQQRIRQCLGELAAEMRRGSIQVNPRYTHGNSSVCDYCEYAAMCGIADDPEAELRRIPEYTAEEVWELLGVTTEEGGSADV